MVAVEALRTPFGDQHLVVERLHRVALEDALQESSPDPKALPVGMHEDVGDVDGKGSIGHGACVPHDRAVVRGRDQ